VPLFSELEGAAVAQSGAPLPVIRISIVVACRNERNAIEPFLASLLHQDLEGMPWEALIADGESDDGTADVVRLFAAQDPRITLVTNPGRTASTGLNAAIRASRGDIILRMDAHTLYAADYCRRCVETLERTGADNVGGAARTSTRGAWAGAISAAYHSRFSTGGARFHQESYEGWVDTVPYGCWRRTTLDRIGEFDEGLVRNQDDELNLRLLRAGGRIWQSREIRSWYMPRDSFGGLFRQYFQYGFWKVAVIRKHRLPASWRHLVPAGFVAANFLLPLGWIAGSRACEALWLSMLAVYAALCLTASILSAWKYGWTLLPCLPPVFAGYHFSYGAGFLAGFVVLVAHTERAARNFRVFTRISRGK
jgi:succinoglycan biosynthesis protein ExoA